MMGGGVKKSQNVVDVIYGWPLITLWSNYYHLILIEIAYKYLVEISLVEIVKDMSPVFIVFVDDVGSPVRAPILIDVPASEPTVVDETQHILLVFGGKP